MYQNIDVVVFYESTYGRVFGHLCLSVKNINTGTKIDNNNDV